MRDREGGVTCVACDKDHDDGECWPMRDALWALLKDKAVPERVRAWARAYLGLDDKYGPRDEEAS